MEISDGVARGITIVGASARAAAQSAARAGYRVHAADLFADRDLRQLCAAEQVSDYPHDFKRVVAGAHSDGWMYTGALENYPRLVDEMAGAHRLWGNSGDNLRAIRDPARVASALNAAGLSAPKLGFDEASLASSIDWLRKSRHSAGGIHVARLGASSRHAIAKPDVYFQEYVEGGSCSATFLGNGREALLCGVTRQLTGCEWAGAENFQYCGSIGPMQLSAGLAEQFAAIGAALARAFHPRGLFGIDAVVNPRGVWTVEVNPRYTASMELFDSAFGMSLVDLHVQACRSRTLPIKLPPAGRCFGKAILFADRSQVVSPGLSDRLMMMAGDDKRRVVADVPMPGTQIGPHHPVLTVLAEGEDEGSVAETLKRRIEQVRATIVRAGR